MREAAGTSEHRESVAVFEQLWFPVFRPAAVHVRPLVYPPVWANCTQSDDGGCCVRLSQGHPSPDWMDESMQSRSGSSCLSLVYIFVFGPSMAAVVVRKPQDNAIFILFFFSIFFKIKGINMGLSAQQQDVRRRN